MNQITKPFTRIFLLLGIVLLRPSANAQIMHTAFAIDCDYLRVYSNNESYVLTGNFRDSVNLSLNPKDTFYIRKPWNSGRFLAKYDSDFNLLWARDIGRHTLNFSGLDFTSDGGIVYSGTFQEEMDLDPGPAERIVKLGPWVRNMFICKLDSNGDLVWANHIPTTDLGSVSKPHVTNNGTISMIGTYNTIMEIKTVDSTVKFRHLGESDIFMLRLNPKGEIIWADMVVGYQEIGGLNHTTDDAGNMYLFGTFEGSLYYSDSAYTVVGSKGGYDNFIFKIDTLGRLVWSHSWGGFDDEQSRSILIDKVGNIVCNGDFESDIDFDPGPNKVRYRPPSGSTYGYVLKFRPDGTFDWVSVLKGSNLIGAMMLDEHNNIMLAGRIRSKATIQNIIRSYSSDLIGTGGENTFLWRLSSSGRYSWAANFGTSWKNSGLSLVYNGNGMYSLTGIFERDMYLGFGTNVDTLLPRQWRGQECYFTQFTIEGARTSMDTMVCHRFTSPSTKRLHTASGVYLDTIFSDHGGDSIMEIHLTVHNPSAGVYRNLDSFVAVDKSVTYQWYDCTAGWDSILAATASFIIPSVGDQVGLIVSDSFGCKDTSDCFTSWNLNIVDQNLQISVYPNPTESIVNIGEHIQFEYGLLIDMYGHIVKKICQNERLIDLTNRASGVYQLILYTSSANQSTRTTIIRY